MAGVAFSYPVVSLTLGRMGRPYARVFDVVDSPATLLAVAGFWLTRDRDWLLRRRTNQEVNSRIRAARRLPLPFH